MGQDKIEEVCDMFTLDDRSDEQKDAIIFSRLKQSVLKTLN